MDQEKHMYIRNKKYLQRNQSFNHISLSCILASVKFYQEILERFKRNSNVSKYLNAVLLTLLNVDVNCCSKINSFAPIQTQKSYNGGTAFLMLVFVAI